jgi:hypothetical protein
MAQSTPALSGRPSQFEATAPRPKRLTAAKAFGGAIQIAIVFGQILIILLSQLQPLLICRW